MLKKIIIMIFTLIGITIGTISSNMVINNLSEKSLISETKLKAIIIISITLIFVLMSLLFSGKMISFLKTVEDKIVKIPISKVLFTTIGLILGLLIATLLTTAIDSILTIRWLESIISALFYIVFGYLGFIIGFRRSTETLNIFLNKFNMQKIKNDKKLNIQKKVSNKVIDSSALIDSRIQDISNTGFLEGKLIIPEFVLKELQLISDSEDPLKRAKGRLGLECIENLQKNNDIDVIIDSNYKYKEHMLVDDLIINYAKTNKCSIITTDYNLNRIATVQSIKVLNVNDLSNAVKPMLSSGERITVNIKREGKESNQGVAYTEDGTMIVVENGKKYVGENKEVEVQSVLQTSSGRIIFTKLV